jgi:hypothetical protein
VDTVTDPDTPDAAEPVARDAEPLPAPTLLSPVAIACGRSVLAVYGGASLGAVLAYTSGLADRWIFSVPLAGLS